GATMLYLASKRDCDRCALKSQCRPKQAGFAEGVALDLRGRSRHGAPDRKIVGGGRTSRRLRKKIEMLFGHLKRILKLDRLRLRGPNGARDEFTLAATAQNLRKLAKLIPMQTLKPAYGLHRRRGQYIGLLPPFSMESALRDILQRHTSQSLSGDSGNRQTDV